MARRGDVDLLDYAGNVHREASRYLGVARARGLDRDDLAQLGYIAILKAWRTHRKNGHPDETFVGYIGPWIRTAMARAVDAPDAVAAGMTGPIDEDLDEARPDCDEGEDAAVVMLAMLTDRQALAVELHLGLDGSPGRPVDVVADMIHGDADRLIRAGLVDLRNAFTQGDR